MGNRRNVSADERLFAERLLRERPRWSSAAAHRYHLLFLALLGQVLDAVDEKLVGADVGPAGLDHPAAQLHQLVGGEA